MGARVLVIEDNPNNLDLVAYLLDAFGHSIIAAPDGEAGLLAAQRDRPDLILCDLHLPGISGFDVVQQLKHNAILRSIPIVAVTALAMVGDKDKVLAAGFDGYLTKPIDPERFVEQLDRFLQATARSTAPVLPPVAQPSEVTEHLVPRHRGTLLIVDNVADNITYLDNLLGELGLHLLSARSVPEAVGLAQEVRPDLILSDIHMPTQDGLDFLRIAKGDPALSDIPFIIVTSSLQYERDSKTAAELGAADVIPRDLESDQMYERILSHLHSDAPQSARSHL